jgi:excisionase family DNA binding protein
VVDEPFLTTDQAAAALGVTSQTIRNWIRGGVLPAQKLGHVFRIRREDFAAFAGTLADSVLGPGGALARDAAAKGGAEVWEPGSVMLPRRRVRREQSVWDEAALALPRRRS